MPRPSNTEERQAQIVAGLLEVMAEKGYERASVNEIARAAGLTAGLVHYHFPSKQAILLRLVEALSEQLTARLAERLAEAGADPVRRLQVFVDVHLARGRDADPRAVACWVGVAAEAIRQPEVAEAFAASLRRSEALLRKLIREALEARGGDTRQARAVAAAVLAAIQGYYVLAAAAPGLVPAGSAAPTVQRLLEGALR